MKKFWNFIRNEGGERVLRLEGPVDEDNFWGDEVTPAAFREELEAEEGDVTVWINSPGGNVFAAAQIYTMLRDHKGRITVKIDAIAASAASVIAMAGDRVLMSPVAMIMIHDPMTVAMGNAKDMEKAITTLNEVKESIINAYREKTGLSRGKISQLMENETWMNAKKAVEYGFADEILFDRKTSDESEEEKTDGKEIEAVWQPYSTKAMGQRVLGWLVPSAKEQPVTDEKSVKAEGDAQDVEPAEDGMTDMAQCDPEGNIPMEDNTDSAVIPADDKNTSVKNKPDEKADSDNPDDPDSDKEDSEEDGEKESKEDGKEESEEDGEEESEEDGEDEADDDDDNSKKPPKPDDTVSDTPVIGLDGKTKDGAMPYDLLKKQLEFLK